MTPRGIKQKLRQRSVTGVDADIGKRIRVRRVELKISQSELGEKLGVSFQQVQKYEKGANRVSVGRISEIARALDVEVGYFYESTGKDGKEVESIIYDDPKFSMRLLRAYAKLPNEQRRKLIGLMEAMAGEEAPAE